MKRIVILLGVLFAAIVGKAQVTERASAILQNGDNAQIFYGADALKDAVEAAPNYGASIFLTAGTFNGLIVTKCVNIYGAGWVTALSATNNDNPIDNSILPTVISTTLGIDVSGVSRDEHNMHIEGLRFSESFYVDGNINGLDVQKCYITKNLGYETASFYTTTQKDIKFKQCYVGGAIFAPYQTTFLNCYIGGNTRFRHTEHDGGWLRFYHCIINNTYNQSPIHDLFECYYSIVFIRNLSNKFFFENCMMDFSDLGLWKTVNWYGMNYSTVFEDANNINYSDERTFILNTPTSYTCPDGTEVGINGGLYPWDKTPQTNVINHLKINSVGGSGVKVNFGPTKNNAYNYAYLWFDGKVDTPVKLGRGETVNTSVLSPGVHLVCIRLQGENGLWSNHLERTMCWLDPGITQAQKITSCEYWIDGVRKLTSNSIGSQQIDVSTLQSGLHTLTMRVLDDQGLWSNQMARLFFVASDAPDGATSITAREFWIDGKIAERQTIDGTPAIIDISDLSSGLHTLTMRVQDNMGIWSNQMARMFFVSSDAPDGATAITAREFWIDGKIAERQTIDGTPAIIDISDLSSGLHMLTFRVQDDKGVWSNQMARLFFVAPLPDVTEYVLTKYMYWLDKDTEHAVTGDIAESDGKLVIDIEALSHDDGEHTFNLCVCDSRGVWSDLAKESFAELATGSRYITIDLNNGDWYDISGKKLNAAPSQSGIYIHNGKKIVIK